MTDPVLSKIVPVSTGSPRISVVVIALVSVFLTSAVWGGFYFGVLREKWKLMQRVSIQLVQHEKLLAHLSHPDQHHPHPWAGLNPELYIPNTADISELLEAVSTEANLTGMVLVNFEEKQEQSLGLVAEIPVLITLTGQYENLVQFIEALNGMSRLTSIKDMRLTVFSSAENQTMLSITLTLVAYRGMVS